ncbi:MAG: glycosyltransferase [Clostridiaceae bacterium]|nr:glycosyltransferase [Clostridiaceae bacterium]
MKIALYTDSFLPIVDGVGRVVVQYANSLAALGHEVYVLCPQADTGYRGGLPYEIVDYVGAPLPPTPQYRAGVPLLDANFRNREQMIGFDIIHAHSPGTTGLEAVRQATRRGIPLVGTFHSKYYDDVRRVTRSDALATVGARYVAEFYRQCTEVWTVSLNAAETLRTYGYRGIVRIMPNGTNITPICAGEEQAARDAFALPDEPMLLYVGQLNFKKNLKRVLEAFAKLRREDIRCTLVLAGQGPDRDALREIARSFGIEKNVLFAGHVADAGLLRGLYRVASLFVFPSLYDTAGLVVREAAVMETPSVVVRGSAPAEVITEGQNGYLCEDTTESLARAIEQALAHPEENRAIGQAARETIPLPWEKVIERAATRYMELIREKGEARDGGK